MILNLFKKLNIKTNNIKLYEEALTHKSFANENYLDYSYQKLEFLGDSIINYLVSKFLYEKKLKNEAEMTKWKINLVQTKSLSKACKEIGLSEYIRVGNSENKENLSLKILDDVFESFCAAVYLDLGENKVIEILDLTLFKYFNEGEMFFEKDYKSILQEKLQAITKKSIEYIEVTKENDKLISIEIHSNGHVYGHGKGETKKQASVNAAINAIENIDSISKQNN